MRPAGSLPSDDIPARLDEQPRIIIIALGGSYPTTLPSNAATYVHDVFKLPHSGTYVRRIGVEPALFTQTMRTFVTRLVGVYHNSSLTYASSCVPFKLSF